MANYPVFPLALGCLLIYGVSVCFYAAKDALMDRMMNWVEASEEANRQKRREAGEEVSDHEGGCPIHGSHGHDHKHHHNHQSTKSQKKIT